MTINKSLTFKTGYKAERGIEKMVHGTCQNFTDLSEYFSDENNYMQVTDFFWCSERCAVVEQSIYSKGCSKHYARQAKGENMESVIIAICFAWIIVTIVKAMAGYYDKE